MWTETYIKVTPYHQLNFPFTFPRCGYFSYFILFIFLFSWPERGWRKKDDKTIPSQNSNIFDLFHAKRKAVDGDKKLHQHLLQFSPRFPSFIFLFSPILTFKCPPFALFSMFFFMLIKCAFNNVITLMLNAFF